MPAAETATVPAAGTGPCRTADRRSRRLGSRTAAAVLLTVGVAGCSGGSGPAPTGTGDQDATACAGRVTPQTLTTLFPGFDDTTGSLLSADWSSGRCSVLSTDGRPLVDVSVQLLASQALRDTYLAQARTATSAVPGPASLGPSVVTGSDRQGAVSLVVGAYWVVVEVKGAPATGSRKDAAIAVAEDVVAYYTAHPAPPEATPSPTGA